jgi:UDP-GlcNAc:undecaprenyl-phosphate GlcNAc-1-phosphate transferase
VSWGGLYVSQLGDLLGFGVVHLHGWSIPFTVVCVLGVVNAVNMTDGMDGLAGGVGFIALLWFGVAAAMLKLGTQTSLLLLLLSALAGFLLFNIRHPWRTRASVIMGDAGSMMAGLAMAWFAVDLTQGEGHSLPPITAVWILALPLLDMGGVMVRRIAKGQSPFAADRKHLHHILLLAGYSGTRVVTILLVLSALMGGVGIAAWQLGIPDYAMFYAFLILLAVYYYLMTKAWSLMKSLKKFHNS